MGLYALSTTGFVIVNKKSKNPKKANDSRFELSQLGRPPENYKSLMHKLADFAVGVAPNEFLQPIVGAVNNCGSYTSQDCNWKKTATH